MTTVEDVESDAEEITIMASPAMQATRALRAPDGDALLQNIEEKSILDNFNASVVKVDNLKVRLAQSKLDDPTFGKVAATLASIGVDPVDMVANGDADAMRRAINLGCDRKRIDALVEHVNTMLFNSAMHARNEEFEKQTRLHQGREWTCQWSKEHTR